MLAASEPSKGPAGVAPGQIRNTCILKIQRAKHHINDLNREINAYLAMKPMAFTPRYDPTTGELTRRAAGAT